MQTAFLALVNYFLAALLLAYNVQAFRAVWKRTEQRHRGVRAAMKIEVAAVLVLCFFTMYLQTGEKNYLWFCLIQLAAYGVITFVYQRLYPKLSELLFDNMLLLLCIGSAVLARLDFSGAVRQFVIVVAALAAAIFLPAFIRAMHRLERYGYAYLVIGIVILLLVFLFAGERLGARIWVKIFGVAMQPFEFVKITFIFGAAAVLLRAKGMGERILGTLFAGIHVLILVASKDLGAAVIFAVLYWVLFYCVTGQKRWVFGGVLLAGGACVAAYVLFSHVQVRVLAWRNPFAVVDNEGYQLAQSLFAIGNGGFFGTGLFCGAPEQIPVVTTDYIFSAICEELGTVFALGLLGIYLNCMVLMIRMAKAFSEDYYRLVFTGFVALFTTQVFLNVGGVTRMIPSTGVPLPFVSAGGSSAASMVLMFMLMQGMQERCQEEPGRGAYKDGFVPGVLAERSRRAIRNCSAAFLAVMGLLVGYVTVFSCTEARTVIFNSYNRRQTKLEEQNARGTIFDADGKPLAVTILSEEGEVRSYPYGCLYSHVVGQVQNGSSGLEAVKEIELLSSSAHELTKLLYRMRAAQIPGNNLFTTLDTTVQKTAHEMLSGECGAVCVLALESGGLLAAVSLPDFEPETAEDYVGATGAPLFNRAFYGEYPAEEATLLFRTAAEVYAGEGIPTPFGERVNTNGERLTPLGAALFAEACAGQGTYLIPHVVKKLTDATGKLIYRTETESETLFDAKQAEQYLRNFQEKKTGEGVSYLFAMTRVPSGTAGRAHVCVMALVPAEQPEFSISVVVEYCTAAGGEKKAEEIVSELADCLRGKGENW